MAVKGGARDCPYTFMHDMLAGGYSLPWEQDVQVTDGTSCGFAVPSRGKVRIKGQPYGATRREMQAHRIFSLPEMPLRNACVPGMSVADNMALRNFDRSHLSSGPFLRRGALREQARRLIENFKVKTSSPESPIQERGNPSLRIGDPGLAAIHCGLFLRPVHLHTPV